LDHEAKEERSHWQLWVGIFVVLGCIVTIAATLNDIF
jgi:hypothetical protein